MKAALDRSFIRTVAKPTDNFSQLREKIPNGVVDPKYLCRSLMAQRLRWELLQQTGPTWEV